MTSIIFHAGGADPAAAESPAKPSGLASSAKTAADATKALQAPGSSYTARESQRIGIVACGYADGYPRRAGTYTPVLVDGVRTGTVGRVSMDMLAVDLTPVPHAGVGREVTLWGCGPAVDGRASLLAIDDVAQAAGTIGNELMCAVAPRVPRHCAD